MDGGDVEIGLLTLAQQRADVVGRSTSPGADLPGARRARTAASEEAPSTVTRSEWAVSRVRAVQAWRIETDRHDVRDNEFGDRAGLVADHVDVARIFDLDLA